MASRTNRSGSIAPVGGPGTAETAAARWITLSSLALARFGLGVAGYLGYEHHTAATTLSCPDTGVINCLKVTTSTYSRFLGLPVSDLGVAYFAAMVLLCLPSSWASPNVLVRRARLATSALGVLFVCCGPSCSSWMGFCVGGPAFTSSPWDWSAWSRSGRPWSTSATDR